MQLPTYLFADWYITIIVSAPQTHLWTCELYRYLLLLLLLLLLYLFGRIYRRTTWVETRPVV